MIPSVIERWLISGYVESGRPLPRWLECRVNRSAHLRLYVSSLRLIESAFTDPIAATAAADVPSPKLAGKIADALAAPRVPARRPLTLGWIAIATVSAVIVLSVFFLLKPDARKAGEIAGPVSRDNSSLPGLLENLRHGPRYAVADSFQRPLNVQWRTLTTQTRRSISGFIRALPGLPVGTAEPVKTPLQHPV